MNIIYINSQDNQKESIDDIEFKSQVEDTLIDIGFARATKAAINKTETRYETIKDGGKIFIARKEYHICSYCGSRSETTSMYCGQCGAPTG